MGFNEFKIKVDEIDSLENNKSKIDSKKEVELLSEELKKISLEGLKKYTNKKEELKYFNKLSEELSELDISNKIENETILLQTKANIDNIIQGIENEESNFLIEKNISQKSLKKFEEIFGKPGIKYIEKIISKISNSKIEDEYLKEKTINDIFVFIENNNFKIGDKKNFYNLTQEILEITKNFNKINNPLEEQEGIKNYKEDRRTFAIEENKRRNKNISKVKEIYSGIEFDKKYFDKLVGGDTENLKPENFLLEINSKISEFKNLTKEDIKKLKEIVIKKFNFINKYVKETYLKYKKEKHNHTVLNKSTQQDDIEFKRFRFKLQEFLTEQFGYFNSELVPNLVFLNKYEGKENNSQEIQEKIKLIREKWNSIEIENDGNLDGGWLDILDPNTQEVDDKQILSKDAIIDLSILNEKDKQTVENMEIYYYSMIGAHIATEMFGGPIGYFGGFGIDVYDAFSSDEAYIALGQKFGMGEVPQDYAKRKTFVDNLLALIGIIPYGTVATKLPKFTAYIKSIANKPKLLEKLRKKMGGIIPKDLVKKLFDSILGEKGKISKEVPFEKGMKAPHKKGIIDLLSKTKKELKNWSNLDTTIKQKLYELLGEYYYSQKFAKEMIKLDLNGGAIHQLIHYISQGDLDKFEDFVTKNNITAGLSVMRKYINDVKKLKIKKINFIKTHGNWDEELLFKMYKNFGFYYTDLDFHYYILKIGEEKINNIINLMEKGNLDDVLKYLMNNNIQNIELYAIIKKKMHGIDIGI